MTIRDRFKGISLQRLCAALFLASVIATLQAQTPTVFTYQGHLTDASLPANGAYDLQFALFDADSGGVPLASAQTIAGVQVTNGTFTVRLDFGAQPFASNQTRYLEMGVRHGGETGEYITLAPRQQLTAVPFAMRSQSAASADAASRADEATSAADAANLGGVAASQYVKTDDSRLSSNAPASGSANYLQNTTQPQTASFNISGDGTAGGTLSAAQFSILGNRVLAVSGSYSNTFVGVLSGASTTPAPNGFLGGNYNSFFGQQAGVANTTGYYNSAFGYGAGNANQTGGGNSYFGITSGVSNKAGNRNTYLGASSDSVDGLTNATAVGFGAYVTRSNSLVLGSSAGWNWTDADTNVGIGTPAPTDRLTVQTKINSYGIVHTDGVITVGTYVGGAGNGGYIGTRSNHPLHLFANDGSASLTIDTSGRVRIVNLAYGGSTQLCRNSLNQVSSCSSSLRYKTNIASFTPGLSLVRSLRPITFDWKDGGARDLGLGAEDVARVEPLLATYNDKGEVEGVKYDRVAVVLVNAVREQQSQLEQQSDEIKRQQQEIKRLTAAIDGLQRVTGSKRRGANRAASCR